MKLISFGYKNRTAPKADHVFDCRSLPNPHDVPELRGKLGTDQAVQDYVLQSAQFDVILAAIPVGDATLAFGCTGGTGRSVAVVTMVARLLENAGKTVDVLHMELPRL